MRDDLPVPDFPESLDPGHVVATAAPHAASLGALMAAIAGWVPVIVAIIPAIYYLILIWESSTVQHYIRNLRMRHQARRILRLKAKAKVVQAKLDAEELIRQARSQAKEKIKVAAHEAATLKATQTAKIEEKLPPV
jgi:hypothetical protein